MKLKLIVWIIGLVMLASFASSNVFNVGYILDDEFNDNNYTNNWSAVISSNGNVTEVNDYLMAEVIDGGTGSTSQARAYSNGTVPINYESEGMQYLKFRLENHYNIADCGAGVGPILSRAGLSNGSAEVWFKTITDNCNGAESRTLNETYELRINPITNLMDLYFTNGTIDTANINMTSISGGNNLFFVIEAKNSIPNGINPKTARTRLYNLYSRDDPFTLNISSLLPVNNTVELIDTTTVKSINLTANATLNFTCSLTINSILNQTLNYTNGTNVFVEFNYTFPVVNATYSFNINCTNNNFSQITPTHLIHINTPLLDNCSSFTTRAINFTVKDSVTDALVNTDASAYFKLWGASEDNYTSYNLTWANRNNFSICISPTYLNYSVYMQMEYEAYNDTSYATSTYYIVNGMLDNVTETTTLYLTNTSTPVTFTVIDQDDNDLANVYIKILLYDIGTASSTLDHIIETDSSGEAIGNIILNSQWYVFILEQDGAIIFQSDPTKITTTSKTFRVTIGSDYFDDYTTVQGVTGDVTFTNSTLTFSFTYTDPSNTISNGCLKVTRKKASADTILYETCSATTAGTLSYAIVENVSNNQYFAVGYITLNGNTFVLDTEGANFGGIFKSFGQEGIFVVFFLVLSMAMIGVSSLSPVIAVLLMVIGIIGATIAGLLGLSWGGLIIYIIMGGFTLYKISRN